MISNHDKRMQRVIEIVNKEPGIKFRELMRELGMSNGSLAWITRKLEKQGAIKVRRTPRNTLFYTNEINEDDLKIIASLRKNTTRLIIKTLLLNEPKEFAEIVRDIARSPATTSFYLNQLVTDGILYNRTRNKKKIFYLQQRNTIDRLIEMYYPSFWTKSSEGLEDIMDSL